MRVVIQRCLNSSVKVDNHIVGHIEHGFVILVGIEQNDTITDAEWLAGKIVQLRVFNDNEGLMNISIQETGGNILAISQFTLHARVKKGNRPSFIEAARPEIAKPLFDEFVKLLELKLGKKIETGVFGAMMEVSIINDGPVTIFIDSKDVLSTHTV